MDRRVCPGCKQELSRSAFYCHRNPSVCPGRRNFCQPPNGNNGLQSKVEDITQSPIGTDDIGPLSEDEGITPIETDDVPEDEEITPIETDDMPEDKEIALIETDDISEGDSEQMFSESSDSDTEVPKAH